MPNSSKITVVKSIRASHEFWETVKIVAEKEKIDKNALVKKAVMQYCKTAIRKGDNNGK